MQLTGKQRQQAVKDIWAIMYKRGVWRAEVALSIYEQEAKEQVSMPGVFWYRVAGTLIAMFWCALLAVMLAGAHPDYTPRLFWRTAGVGSLLGLGVAIMVWREDVNDG